MVPCRDWEEGLADPALALKTQGTEFILWNLGNSSGRDTLVPAPMCLQSQYWGAEDRRPLYLPTGDLQDSERPHLKGGGCIPGDGR